MFSLAYSEICLAILACSLVLYYQLSKSKTRLPLPPGPRPLPIIGNVLDMPTHHEWKVFTEWGRKWGGIVHVSLMGKDMMIVNSAKILEELERKGSIYSDRPRLEFAGEMVGYSKTIVLMRYGARFRGLRRYIAQMIGSVQAVQRLSHVLEHETRRFLQRTLSNPNELGKDLRKLDGAIIMKLIYGIEVQEKDDPFVSLIEKANGNFSVATAPGAFLVDVFPVLRYLPEWLPGAGFKQLGRSFASAFNDMVDVPYTHTRKLMSSGAAPFCFVSSTLDDENHITPDRIWDVRHCAASMYGAGADTIASAQHAFFLAMILYPEIQRKAQEEISSVIGDERLPVYEDRANLPYVNALVKELMRWHNVAPLGVPHAAMEDGIIGGYFVPKGTIIVSNLWGILHDPEVYPDPFTFDPTRFIERPGKPAQKDPRHACFGWSRRICPGMYLAEASLWLCVAMSLTVFNVTNAVEDGVPIIPIHENTSGTISHPVPFEYNLKPRSAKVVSLVSEN